MPVFGVLEKEPRMLHARASAALPVTFVVIVAAWAAGQTVSPSPGAPRAAGQGQPARPPNFIVILTDDQGYGDLSSYGHPTIHTPNIDRMASEGVRLTSFYASASVCTPSRAGLLTGRYAVRSGVTSALGPGAKVGLPPSEITLAEALRPSGYRSALVGKWHLGDRPEFNPLEHGFDAFLGLPYSNDYMPPFVAGTPPVPLFRNRDVIERPVVQPTMTARMTEAAIRFIRESQAHPFFLYLAHPMPHLPLSASEPFRGRSRAGLYGDVIEEIDWSVGEVLRTVRELGLDEHTLTVFTSDNGPWLNAPPRMMQAGVRPWDVGSAGALRDAKGTTYEGGFRVPGIARWPGRIPAGRWSPEPASNLDVFPTFLHLVGADLPGDRPIDGRNILPLLEGTGVPASSEFFYFAGPTLHAVRDGPWKLRIAPAAKEEPIVELYNVEVDPSERHNVAAEHPPVVERLRLRLEAFTTELARGG